MHFPVFPTRVSVHRSSQFSIEQLKSTLMGYLIFFYFDNGGGWSFRAFLGKNSKLSNKGVYYMKRKPLGIWLRKNASEVTGGHLLLESTIEFWPVKVFCNNWKDGSFLLAEVFRNFWGTQGWFWWTILIGSSNVGGCWDCISHRSRLLRLTTVNHG